MAVINGTPGNDNLLGTPADQPRPGTQVFIDTPTSGPHTYILGFAAQTGFPGTAYVRGSASQPVQLGGSAPRPGALYRSAQPGGLGYRGFMIRHQDNAFELPRELAVFHGVVTEQPGDKASHWRDVGGLEGWLLDQARSEGYGEILAAAGVQAPNDRPG